MRTTEQSLFGWAVKGFGGVTRTLKMMVEDGVTPDAERRVQLIVAAGELCDLIHDIEALVDKETLAIDLGSYAVLMMKDSE